MLFLDARALGALVDRTHKEFSESDVDDLAGTFHAWRGTTDDVYFDDPGFSASVDLDSIRHHRFALSPARYTRATPGDDQQDDEAGEELQAQIEQVVESLELLLDESEARGNALRDRLRSLDL